VTARLIKLKDAPIRIEGRFGAVTLTPTEQGVAVLLIPDHGYVARKPAEAESCLLTAITRE
jgi:hypothetical protein